MTRIYPPSVAAKSGGTSVADFDAMNRSTSIVLADQDVRLVVLSASAGVTNLLIELSEGLETRQQLDKIEALRAVQYNIISRLKQPSVISTEVDNLLNSIRRLAQTVVVSPSDVSSDELVSHGRLMSSLLFTEVLRERHVETGWFDARSVIRANSNFGCAEPKLGTLHHQVETHLRPRLEQAIMVTQGFIGRNAAGHTTALGRGGSDYTATLLGEALHATRVDIWTDVAGTYTTDPRIAPRVKRIDYISFSEASDMTAYGTKVLHPATLLPAMRKSISVFVGLGKDTAAGGTLVHNTTDNPPRYRVFAVRRKQTLLRLHNLEAQPSCSFLAQSFTILARHAVTVDLVITSENSIALALDATHTTSGEDHVLTTALFTALSFHCHVEVEIGLALVTLVGNQLTQAVGVCKNVFAWLEEHMVQIVCRGASNDNLSILLPADNIDSAIKALYYRLFGQRFFVVCHQR